MAKKREMIDQGFTNIINKKRLDQAGQDGKPTRKPNPLGVVLDQAEIDRLESAAAEIGINRHQLMQLAIRQFLADFDKGRRPKTSTKTITVIEPD
jgi:hypothetical protein